MRRLISCLVDGMYNPESQSLHPCNRRWTFCPGGSPTGTRAAVSCAPCRVCVSSLGCLGTGITAGIASAVEVILSAPRTRHGDATGSDSPLNEWSILGVRSAVSRAVHPFVIPRLPMTADCNRFREKTRGLSGRSVQQDAGDDATHGFAQLEISVARGTASRLERVELFQKPNEAPFLRPRRASPQKCLNNQGVVSNRRADRTGGGMTGAPPFWGLSIRCVDRHQFVTRPMKGNRDSRHFGTAKQTPPFRQRGRPLSGSHGGLQQADPPGMCGTVPSPHRSPIWK